MSLRKEFGSRVAVLDNVGFSQIMPRLIGLLKWFNETKEIKRILDDLKGKENNPHLGNVIKAGDSRKAASSAATLEAIAFIGLSIMETCVERIGQQEMDTVARGFFANNVSNSFQRLGDAANAAIEMYIRPLLDYVEDRLPEDSAPVPTAELLIPFVPVAIQDSLQQFQKDHPNADKVAFIMMQFSDTSAHTGIEAAIKSTLTKYNFTGLLARDKEYHDEMLPNIQTYMHGCGFGIAVFERIEKEVFNPNVSLEVGYMMALKKRVLLLKDKNLMALHADLVGKLYRSFDVQHPAETIPDPLEAWMEEKGLI